METHTRLKPPLVKSKIRFLFFTCLLSACAGQFAPSGGPEDKQPPRIIATIPEKKAVNVPLETEVVFRFSEKINRESFQKAFFMTPRPRGKIQLDVGGTKGKLRFSEPLLKDRTYIVTLGTDLKDMRRVSMAQSFTLAFSTGDSLDEGEISGRVYGDNVQGVSLWAYILPDSGDAEAIDPRKKSGDYITQAGQNGDFQIPFISRGKYRVFAVNDQGRNGVYDPVEDQIGVPMFDIELTPGKLTAGELDFRLTREDTTRPAVDNVSMRNNSTVEVRFDEVITAADTAWAERFKIVKKESGDTLRLLDASRLALDAKVFRIRVEPQTVAANLEFFSSDVADTSGNAIDEKFASFEFKTSIAADTGAPKILRVAPEDSSRNHALGQKVRVVFSEWMQRPDSAVGLVLLDSTDAPIAGELAWKNPFELVLTPVPLLQSASAYRISLQPSLLRDAAGNALFDTLGTRIFYIYNIDTLTSISGTIIDSSAAPDSASIFLFASPISSDGKIYKTTVDGPGEYLFEKMLPGVFLIEGFIDKNGNGKYDFGRISPFVPAERFFVYPDSIKTRSRWPNEGNDIFLKK